MAESKTTILLYGRTRAGKTAQLGELAEYVFRTTGKITRLYSADKGGVITVQPHIDLGLIDAILIEESDPWIFLHNAVLGKVRKDGKWAADPIQKNIGMYAFESVSSFSDAIMISMAKKSAEGINIGGGSNVSFVVEGDGEKLKVGGGNMAHYKVAQDRVTEEMFESQRLPCSYLVWTAGVAKDDDLASANKVLGPAAAGNALTPKIPGWFNLSFRIDCLPAEGGKPERHILYLGNSKDMAAGNAIGLGNTRTALDAPPIKETTIEPASIVKALELIRGGYGQAKETISKRLGPELLNKLKALKG